VIRLRGVRHNNLKNLDLDLPLHQLIVVTGLSGSGKSSLAFDTLFAEGQRRYIETFSPYARQFFDRMDKPQVDSIEGIPPAIAIEQRNSVRTTRSTVGTMTEVCDYMKMLWPHVAQLHCRQCGRPVRKDSPQDIWRNLMEGTASGHGTASAGAVARAPSHPAHGECLVTFDLPLTEKLSLDESLGLVSKQGYQRLLVEGQLVRIEAAQSQLSAVSGGAKCLTVVQDRLRFAAESRPRFVEACEQAYHFGKGKLAVWEVPSSGPITGARVFSSRLHCAACDLEYREPTPALFSFNHPVGACPACRGFGRVISIDYGLALPDRSRTLAEGVVKPWLSGMSAECQTDLMRMCRQKDIPVDVPFHQLPQKWQDLVIEGDPDYGKDAEHEWPQAWYGVKGYFRWLEGRAYKMHVRVLLSRYRAYTTCPQCQGRRFQPEALLYRARGAGAKAVALTLADFYQLSIQEALRFLDGLATQVGWRPNDPLGLVLGEVRARLEYLDLVGLGYLTLDRPTRTLSGGETERVSLTTCLGTRLVNTLFVLDEPSVGLHPRDTERLVKILEQLRSAGNTVVVVEHEPGVMRAADHIVDLGPGHGATGGELVFQGTFKELLQSRESMTGQYLSGRRRIELPSRRPVPSLAAQTKPRESGRHAARSLALREAHPPYKSVEPALRFLTLAHASRNNLEDFTVAIPLNRLVCVTGVSGSGKTTLLREVLLPALEARLGAATSETKASDRLGDAEEDNQTEGEAPDSGLPLVEVEGVEHLDRVVLVDQTVLGKTPRSNPAVYIGAFDHLREFFAQSDLARQRGLNASAFSFNSSQGQCERCRGAGFEKIEMQFLSDVFVRCPDCDGRRYREHILQVKLSPGAPMPPSQGRKTRQPKASQKNPLPPNGATSRSFSIADLLEATVDEAIDFLGLFPESRPAERAAQGLKLLQEVGLGYLKLGQPINTLSGGESQRLKLVKHLAVAEESVANSVAAAERWLARQAAKRQGRTAAPGLSRPATTTLFLFDEPTTGLHFEDVRILLKVFQRLVDAGHSVIVIEHNLDVIKSADWLIDLGPEAGEGGGRLVVEGTPEQVATCEGSHTGRALRAVLQAGGAALRLRSNVS
jgi:excinuclease ABC subunit A